MTIPEILNTITIGGCASAAVMCFLRADSLSIAKVTMLTSVPATGGAYVHLTDGFTRGAIGMAVCAVALMGISYTHSRLVAVENRLRQVQAMKFRGDL